MPILLLLLISTIVEISVLIMVGQAIGLLPTILLLIAATALGVWLLRREGAKTLAAFREAMVSRRPPQRELADGMLIAAAGLLIMVPGFVSDVLALFLLFPPTRAIATRGLTRRAAAAEPTASWSSQPFVVDATVIDTEVADADDPTRGRDR